MTRKSLAYPLTACLALASGAAHAATITSVGTTGVFDEAGGTNDIDVQFPATLADFKAALAIAYPDNLGGVIDWETGLVPAAAASNAGAFNNTVTTVDAAYGAGAADKLTIGFGQTMELYTNNVNGQASVLSSNGTFRNSLISAFANPTPSYIMSFSGAAVVEIGAGMLSRSSYQGNGATGVNFRATATFSDMTTSTIDYTITASGTDTFLNFKAPTGTSISTLGIAWVSENGATTALNTGQRRPVMDDFGFIVVPEASSAALLGLGALAAVMIRRRG